MRKTLVQRLSSTVKQFFRSWILPDFSNAGSWVSRLYGINSISGAKVNRAQVEGLSAVWRANAIISEAIASLPLEVYERIGNGNVRLATDHPLFGLLHSEPSPYYTSFTFRQTLQTHLNFHGNAYVYLRRNGNGRIVEMQIIDPRYCYPTMLGSDVFYYVNGFDDAISAENIVHIPGNGFDGLKGKSIIAAFAETMGLSISVRDYGAHFFANGAHLNGVLETEKSLSPERAKALGNSFKDAYAGVDKTGNIAVLADGMQYRSVSLNPADAMFIETRKFDVEEIARIFGVPAHKLQSLDNATFNNIEHLDLDFLRSTLRQWVRRWEQELDRKIFFQSERNRFFVRFNLEGFNRGDTSARTNYYKELYGIGVLSQNDIRQMENLNTIEGGDRYYVPINNMAPSDLVDQILLNQNANEQVNEE